MVTTLARKIRTARKTHHCMYCNTIIKPGEKYEWAKCVYDGDLYEIKNCLPCNPIAEMAWLRAWYDYAENCLTIDNIVSYCYEADPDHPLCASFRYRQEQSRRNQ